MWNLVIWGWMLIGMFAIGMDLGIRWDHYDKVACERVAEMMGSDNWTDNRNITYQERSHQ